MTGTLSLLIGMSLGLTGSAWAQSNGSFNPMTSLLQGQQAEENLARAMREGIAAREYAEDRVRALAREDREDQERAANRARLKAREEAREWERRIAPTREESKVDWSQAREEARQARQDQPSAMERYAQQWRPPQRAPRTPTVTNPYSPYLGLPTDLAEGQLQRQILQLHEKIDELERQRR
jgi:hypothetical protein